VNRAEARQRVLEAIEEGRIPKGGPSELAAHELLDDVPASYWERWSEGALERIREQTSDRTNDPGQ
jgi:hypothetical protein